MRSFGEGILPSMKTMWYMRRLANSKRMRKASEGLYSQILMRSLISFQKSIISRKEEKKLNLLSSKNNKIFILTSLTPQSTTSSTNSVTKALKKGNSHKQGTTMNIPLLLRSINHNLETTHRE